MVAFEDGKVVFWCQCVTMCHTNVSYVRCQVMEHIIKISDNTQYLSSVTIRYVLANSPAFVHSDRNTNMISILGFMLKTQDLKKKYLRSYIPRRLFILELHQMMIHFRIASEDYHRGVPKIKKF